VRGYEEDKLATELIEVGVPPLAGVQQFTAVARGGQHPRRREHRPAARAVPRLEPGQRGERPVRRRRLHREPVGWPDLERRAAGRWPGPAPGLGVGSLSVEYALPLLPRLGDDGNGTWHFGLSFRQ
jgi:hypothetical protein